MPPTLPTVMISESSIANRVQELARRISKDYGGIDELIMVGVLRGAFIFLADLSRKLTIPRRVDFMALSAYSGTDTAPGPVRLLMDLRTNIADRHVLVVEDIVDTGRTLRYLLDMLQARGPASLKSCVLVRKPGRAEVEVAVDYLGFEIPDEWVAGYGLDYSDQYRTLPYIGVVKQDTAVTGDTTTRK